MVRILLRPLSAIYGLIMSIRNWLYDRGLWRSESLSVPVVSVGNLTLGGTGKTPIICELLRWATENRLSAAVISRGYKGQFESSVARVPVGADPGTFGDEPAMIADRFRNTPVYVGRDRVKVARQLLAENPNVKVIFADDAFQHRRLRRDVDIVVVDCMEPIENYTVIPAGRGREAARCMRRADCIVLNKVNLVSPERKQTVIEFIDETIGEREIPVIESEYYVRELIRLDGHETVEPREFETVTLVSGIGNPRAFETLIAKNFDVKKHFVFRDHHKYSRGEIQRVVALSRGCKAKRILTTEKDAVKLRPLTHESDFFWQAELRPKLSLRVKWLYEKILSCVH